MIRISRLFHEDKESVINSNLDAGETGVCCRGH